MTNVPSVCLNMIVKNESHIIERTLEMLCSKICFSYWVICDTGSTDDTCDIIKNFFKQKKISGELYEDEWKNFAHNRTLALNSAYNKSDLLLIFDADDEIRGEVVLPKTVDCDGYFFNFGGSGITYQRILLVNNRIRWCFKSVIHEFIACLRDNGDYTTTTVEGDYYVVSGRSGSRSQDPHKYVKDARILEEAYFEAKKTNDDLHLRYAFYCANSYRDAGMSEKAIEWYKTTLQNNNWHQEKYISCLYMHNEYCKIGEQEKGMFYLVESFRYDTERLECAYNLIKHYCIIDLNRVAYQYYGMVKSFYETHYLTHFKTNFSGKLFVDQSVGNFYLPYYMIIVADKMIGTDPTARDTILKMYEIVFITKCFVNSEFHIRNFLYNLQFFIDYSSQHSSAFIELFQSFIDLLDSNNFNVHGYDFMKHYDKYGIKYKRPNSILPRCAFSKEECKKSNKILFYSGFAPFAWNYTYSTQHALGGSETALANLSRLFPSDFEIYVAGTVLEEKIDNINNGNVTYVNVQNLSNLVKTNAFHTIVVSRYVGFYEMFPETAYYQSFIWAHDVVLLSHGSNMDAESILRKWSNKITGCVCQTEWHKNLFVTNYPVLQDKMFVINNGIILDKFTCNPVKIPNRFIYTSCSERGLERLLELWPQIVEKLPDAELCISSYNRFPSNDFELRLRDIMQKYEGVKHVGSLNKAELYEMMASAEYWLYPTSFNETSCITAMEMLMSEVICIYYPVAGLVNTIGNYGIPVQPGQEIDAILELSTSRKNSIKEAGKEYATSCSWNNRALQWLELMRLNNNSNNGNDKSLKKKRWCFYHRYFTIETISQFIENQLNYNGDTYEIIITDNADEIVKSNPSKVSFIYALFDETILARLDANCEVSILQTEPLNLTWRLNAVLEIHNKHPSLKIYDYSKSNIKILNQHNITNCEYLSYNIQSAERNTLMHFLNQNKDNKIYDFGFIYNWKSLPADQQHIINPPKRRKVVDFLRTNGFKVNIVAGYGDDREIELSKCKIILNVHGQINNNENPSADECSNIFEHVRCDRLLECGFNVLSESSYELDVEYSNKYKNNLTVIKYEDFFDINVINGVMMKVETNCEEPKKYCFIHSCNLENAGTHRLEHLIRTLRLTECENVFEKIIINNIGLPIENIYGDKYEVINCSENSKLYENPTINLINDFSNTNPNSYILYLHTKGIRYSKEDDKENDWINYMLYFLVEEYRNCISILDEKYDTAGCDYSIELDQKVFDGYHPYPPPPHYSGNFWWANSNYLKTLPKLCVQPPDRNAPEFWLFQNNPNCYNLHSSNINHFHMTYPRTAYAHDKTSHTSTSVDSVDSVDDDRYNMNKIDDDINVMFQYGTLNNTDKVFHHEYHKYYDSILQPFRNSHGGMVEIGIDDGLSLPMWTGMFKNAHVYGIDKVIKELTNVSNKDKCTTIQADQSNANDLKKIKSMLMDKNIFFINDDGSHIPEHQLLSFNTLFPILMEGGIYIIEDIETSYWIKGVCYDYKTEYGYKHSKSIIEIFKDSIDIMNREFVADKTQLSNQILHHNYIESVSFGRNCIIVKKKYNANREYRFKHNIL
jgi:hypothetical protein